MKLPKVITHELRLVGCAAALDAFLAQAEMLEPKLAVLLVQLPPSLVFDEQSAVSFFSDLRARTSAAIACEPRHLTWFDAVVDAQLQELKVARVAADPARCEAAGVPGGWPGLRYWRLHGSPVMYRSSYADRLPDYAAKLRATAGDHTWCIFDNTASSAAIPDALALARMLSA